MRFFLIFKKVDRLRNRRLATAFLLLLMLFSSFKTVQTAEKKIDEKKPRNDCGQRISRTHSRQGIRSKAERGERRDGKDEEEIAQLGQVKGYPHYAHIRIDLILYFLSDSHP